MKTGEERKGEWVGRRKEMERIQGSRWKEKRRRGKREERARKEGGEVG